MDHFVRILNSHEVMPLAVNYSTSRALLFYASVSSEKDAKHWEQVWVLNRWANLTKNGEPKIWLEHVFN